MLKKPSNILVICCLVVIFLATSWSLFNTSFFHVHDTSHAARIAEMTRALDDGHWPVRWVSNFGLGYGMPLFEFYAPLPYLVGAIFYGLGLNIIWSIKVLYLLCSLLTVIGSYYLGKEISGQKFPAVLTSAAISLAPYRAVDLFVRGALSEAWGIMAIPWILYGVLAVAHQRRFGWQILTFSLVVLFLSHNLTTLMFLPFLLIFMSGWFNRSIKIIFSAIFLAIGLSAFYLFPAVLEQKYTSVFNLSISSFHYADYFVFGRQLITPLWGYGGAAPGPYNDQSNFLGYGQLMGMGFALFLSAIYLVVKKRLNSIVITLFLLTVLLLLSIFMLHGRSSWLWQNFTLIQVLQFPWRWLSLAIIWLGLIGGLGSLLIKNQLVRNIYCLLLSLVIVLGNYNFFKPKAYLTQPETYYFIQLAQIRRQAGPGFIDYLPKTMTQLSTVNYVATANSEVQSIKVLQNKTQQKIIATNFSQTQTVSFGTAAFPGWEIKIDQIQVGHFIDEKGQLAVPVPAGNHQVTASFKSTLIRWWSDFISLICWTSLILYGCLQYSRIISRSRF